MFGESSVTEPSFSPTALHLPDPASRLVFRLMGWLAPACRARSLTQPPTGANQEECTAMAKSAYPGPRRVLTCFFLATLLFPLWVESGAAQEPSGTGEAQEVPAFTPQELTQAAARLREFYYGRAWALGVQEGDRFNLQAPDALEVRAWYALNLARNGQVGDAIEVGEDLVERAPDEFWSNFALAGSLFRDSGRRDEAEEPGEKAASLDPDNLDGLSLYVDILRYTQGQQEAIDYIDSLPPELGGHALVQVRKAVALDALAGEAEDEGAQAAAYDYFRQVMALDTTFLEPVFFLGTRLRSAEDQDEAQALIQRAADLTLSHEVHRYVWRSILARRDIGEEEKVALLDEAIQDLWDRGGKTAGALQSAASMYEQANRTEIRDSLWAIILAEYPDSPGAEWALVSRYRALSSKIGEQTRAGEAVDPELKAEYRRQVESFLLRPEFHRETLRGDAYRSLFYHLSGEETVDPELLHSVVKGMELYEGMNLHIIYAMGPLLMADEGIHLDYAEALVRKGMVESKKELEEYRERGVFDTEEEYERAEGSRRATFLDALGWVLFAKGSLDDAEGTLLEALQATDPGTSVFLHLGKVYEERYARAVEEHSEDGAEDYLDRALDFYLKGTLVQAPGKNPNDEALETLYAKRFGSMEGFEAFTAGATATDADARMDKILGERIEDPKNMTAFAMATLDGDTIRSEDLAGKVVVINFWGTWCGPCVLEMPGIQEVYDQYETDPAVVVLTLSNDENIDVLRRFMEREEYTFPVLLDDGYAREENVTAFPTTWFVTPEGFRAFEKRGWSDDLPQEFGWRVEALRGG